jgi:hypothetical protein
VTSFETNLHDADLDPTTAFLQPQLFVPASLNCQDTALTDVRVQIEVRMLCAVVPMVEQTQSYCIQGRGGKESEDCGEPRKRRAWYDVTVAPFCCSKANGLHLRISKAAVQIRLELQVSEVNER